MKVRNFPRSVDLIVTENCNLKCNVCWGSELPNFVKQIFNKRKQLFDILKDEGVEQIIFTGGEPLLDPELPELIKYAHNKMRTWLFTNSLLLYGVKDEILPFTDRISFSLDGPNEEINKVARKEGHFDSVINGLEILRQEYSDIKTQILTVVTKLNRESLIDIGYLLEKQKGDLNFLWKLNYYRPIGRFNDNYIIPYQEFRDIAKDITRIFKNRLQIKYSIHEHDKGYLFIMPDGKMYTVVGNKYMSVGILQDRSTYDFKTIAKIRDNLKRRDEEITKQSYLKNDY